MLAVAQSKDKGTIALKLGKMIDASVINKRAEKLLNQAINEVGWLEKQLNKKK